jgi:hypothetical protein
MLRGSLAIEKRPAFNSRRRPGYMIENQLHILCHSAKGEKIPAVSSGGGI